ncbi:MAG: hypothetical protein H6738_04485 [Alphaproteobacteria bacterium]|nr:hypothetical protein [Alphaproteobacteria bacterium]
MDAPEPVVIEVGVPEGPADLVGVVAWMQVEDYLTAEAFEGRLGSWLDAASARGWLGPGTVVVFPEYVGTWLVAVDEKPRTVAPDTTTGAMKRLVTHHLGAWRRAKRKGTEDAATEAVFAMKGDRVAEVWQDAMAHLATRHGVTLVAGSALLPEPALVDGRLVPTPKAPLRNVSAIFGPDGSLLAAPVVKAFPTAHELPFVLPGDPARLPAIEVGGVGLGDAGVRGRLVSGSLGRGPRRGRAGGRGPAVHERRRRVGGALGRLLGLAGPEDVDPADVGAITEGEAWARYGPTARGAARGLDVLTVPLRGQLWDLGDDGQARWVVGGVTGRGHWWMGPYWSGFGVDLDEQRGRVGGERG